MHKMSTYPCSVCSKNVNSNHHAICCDICDQWVHIRCNLLEAKTYNQMKNDSEQDHPDKRFYCISCIQDNIPFTKLTDPDYYATVKKGVMISDEVLENDQLSTLNCQKYIEELNSYISNSITQNDNEDDNSLPPIDCKYYSVDDFTEAGFLDSKVESVFHINIHSIEKHIEELRTYLMLIDFQFDVLAISESKLQKNMEPKVDISINGYHYPLSTPTKATKGGVLLYIKENHVFKPRPNLHIYADKTSESCFAEIINCKGKNSIVGVIYRHPTGNSFDFIETYLKPLVQNKLSKAILNKKIYIAGDFNYDLTNISSEETSDFFDLMTSSQLLPTISLPTKLNTYHDTLIDNIFTNQYNPDLTSGNFTLQLSDHLASFLIAPNENIQYLPKKHNITKRDTKSFNEDVFLTEIKQINWDDILQCEKTDTNHSFNSFYDTIEHLLDKHMPKRKITKQEFKQRFKPWVTKGILTSIRRREKLLKKYTRAKNYNRKQEIHGQYITLRNKILELTRISKRTFYQNYFRDNNNNLRKVWQGIKEIISIKTKSNANPVCVMEDDDLLTNPIGISNSFNKYYSNIAENILNKRAYDGDGNFIKYMPDPVPNSLFFTAVDADEIRNLIKSFDPAKAAGPCSIPPKILNLICESISNPISKIANLSFQTGVHPERLKVAKVVPIFKSGSKMLTSNYRPISLLSNLNKILEKLMFTRVFSFLEKENAIYDKQFGFRPKHSTNHAIISITEKIREALDNDKFACGVFVDLQKAFDTVNHEILLQKLQRYGIRGDALKWFKSYLTDRLQFVSILGFESDKLLIKHGVPQGSVLGPLLFLIYINDLYKAIQNSETYLFADDTNLLNINSNFKHLQKQMNADLKCLCLWLLANKISLNKTKTELIFFKKPNTEIPSNIIKINGLKLYPSQSVKYLGIYLDEHLNGSAHIDILVPKLRRANGMLAKIRHYTSPEQVKSIYHAIFASHMTYGCQVWGRSFTNTHINKIQVLQNNALRLITFCTDFRDHVTPIYAEQNILKIMDLISLKNLLLIHDYFKNKLPSTFNDYYKLADYQDPQNLEDSRQTKIPTKYREYELTEPDMQPQSHNNIYKFRNENIYGQLDEPEYNSIKYGRNSLKLTSILLWNNFKKHFPNTDFLSLSRADFRNLISKFYMDGYENTDMK
jgi:exonuclease III